jgi:hypothetical protein
MVQEQLLRVNSYGFSPDLLSHPGREFIAGGQVLHLMQMQFMASEPHHLRVIQ